MKAEYIAHSGTDLTVVNAARVSFDKELDWERTHCDPVTLVPDPELAVLGDRDAKLIRYLAAHNHFTPFTHCTITLRETVPIFVARQRFKHTIGFSYNEVSRRYVETPPEFFYPKEWRELALNKKQGSGGPISDTDAKEVWEVYYEVLYAAEQAYGYMIRKGVAPEQARMVLPQSMYTSYYVTGSLAAFARAYKLRTTEDAQQEIRDLATYWSDIISPLYPVSWKELISDH